MMHTTKPLTSYVLVVLIQIVIVCLAMKIRRGPEVERIINDPPPPSDSEANNEKVSYSIQNSIKLSFEVPLL